MMSYLEKIFEVGISDEYRWERIRYWRDKLLRDSDVKMISDSPWDKIAWAEYRQQLRDLPSSNLDPSKIVFPNEPK
jgi:hypothetical protein